MVLCLGTFTFILLVPTYSQTRKSFSLLYLLSLCDLSKPLHTDVQFFCHYYLKEIPVFKNYHFMMLGISWTFVLGTVTKLLANVHRHDRGVSYLSVPKKKSLNPHWVCLILLLLVISTSKFAFLRPLTKNCFSHLSIIADIQSEVPCYVHTSQVGQVAPS
jgi:hypothetical protein